MMKLMTNCCHYQPLVLIVSVDWIHYSNFHVATYSYGKSPIPILYSEMQCNQALMWSLKCGYLEEWVCISWTESRQIISLLEQIELKRKKNQRTNVRTTQHCLCKVPQWPTENHV